jgi:hypothetical protein
MSPDLMDVMSDEINRHKLDTYGWHWSMDADYVRLDKELHALTVRATKRNQGAGYNAKRRPAERRRRVTRTLKAQQTRRQVKAVALFAHTCIFACGVCRCGQVRP